VPTTSAPAGEGIPSSLVILLAASCGVSAASLYYAQPLLHTIAGHFHSSPGTAGLLVTFAQIGYAGGLALLVPIGDLVNRRALVPGVLLLCAIALAASALAPSIGVLIALSLAVGVSSVMAQVLVPWAASMARPAERGKVTGSVMSGLLLGILLARTMSGIIAGAAGWRVVYWVACALVALTAAVLARRLPSDRRSTEMSYRSLLAGTAALSGRYAVLRRRMLLGGLCFATFSVFWTTAAFLLAGPPFHYGDTLIGLFGLVGAGGALCANFAGRMADRGYAPTLTLAFALCIAASFGLLLAGRSHLVPLVAGVFVLDVGVQGLHITNFSVVLVLDPDARSRINANYMVAYFAGGATGSAVASAVYSSAGWSGVCALGAAIGGTAVAVGMFDWVRPAAPAAPVGEPVRTA
jgi:predicted MFS family arabinose efflux permease